MQDMVKDSVKSSIKLCIERGLRFAREDFMIQGKTITVDTKKGGKYQVYLEAPGMNLYAKPRKGRRKSEKAFHNRKFAVRTGNLLKSFTPAGTWSGNHLRTMGEGSVDVVCNDKENYAIIRFTGEAEKALRHGDSRNKVEITDKNGNFKDSRTSRKPMDGFRKTVHLFNSNLKSEMDKNARAMR